jgi:hypothetical protein
MTEPGRFPVNRRRSLTIEPPPTPNGCCPAGRFRVRPHRYGVSAVYRRAVTRKVNILPSPVSRFAIRDFPLPFFTPP